MEGLSHTLTESLGATPSVMFFGFFPVPTSVIISWIVMAILVIGSILLTRNLKKVPSKPQMILEMAVGFLNNFCKEHLGQHWRPFAPWLGTVALYILLCNLGGVFGVTPPTRDLTITATLALMSMLLIYGSQFRYRGLVGGLRRFAQPTPILLPINLMEIAIRPLSLCMRLFGTILAGHIIMEMIKYLAPAVIPIPFSLYFDFFDGIIQAIVFVFLTTLFIGEGIAERE